MQVIAVANQKGGVGKSTTTINIAAYLAKFGNRVLVIDLDPQGHSTKGLGVQLKPEQRTVADALCDSDAENLHEILQETYIENLYVMPANLTLALVEMKLSSMGAKEFKLRTILPKLGQFDWVLIDCPPTFTTLTINAFTTAEHILLPVQLGYFCMDGIDGFVQAINFVNKQINPVVNHKIDIKHVLITFYNPQTKLSRNILPNMTDIFGDKIFASEIPVNIKLGEAQAEGKAIMDYDEDCSGCKAYKEVTMELQNRYAAKTVCRRD